MIAICADDPMLFEGACERLKACPAHLVLMSPVPPAEGSALARLMAATRTTRIPGLPGPQAGEAELIDYSLPGLSSLAPPVPALSALLPGLRETGRRTVTRLAPTDMTPLLADLPEPLTLWIDLSGAEAEILGALAAAGVLERVHCLELRCGIEPFFAGAEGRAEIETRLGALDFTLEACTGDDPDWPDLRFRADPQARRIRALDASLAEARAAAAAARQQAAARIAELEAQLAGQAQALQDLRAKHQTLSAEMVAAQESIVVLNSECRKRLVALEAEAARANDLTTRNAELHHRWQGAREDLRRAEGQMTLIKDLLLHEAGL